MQPIYKEGPDLSLRPIRQQLKCKSTFSFRGVLTDHNEGYDMNEIMIWQKLN